MFLHLFQTDEEKVAFIQMAFIVAIAHVEDSDEESEEKTVGLNSRMNSWMIHMHMHVGVKSFDSNWKMSAFEKAIIDGFLRELNSSDDDVNISSTNYFRLNKISINYSRLNEIVDELAPVLAKLTQLSAEERRLEIIEKLIEDGIAWDTIEQIDPKSARSMMIELLRVALVDGDYAPLEKVVIESIAKKLSIDADEIEEMEAFVRNMNQVYQSGLEIIIN